MVEQVEFELPSDLVNGNLDTFSLAFAGTEIRLLPSHRVKQSQGFVAQLLNRSSIRLVEENIRSSFSGKPRRITRSAGGKRELDSSENAKLSSGCRSMTKSNRTTP